MLIPQKLVLPFILKETKYKLYLWPSQKQQETSQEKNPQN